MTQNASPSEVVAARVKLLRSERRLSARQLAEMVAACGVPMDRDVLANIETGRRRSVAVGEWLALAAALDVPPLALLLPTPEQGRLEVIPRAALDEMAMRSWVSGQAPLSTFTGPSPKWEDVSAYVQQWRSAEARQREDREARAWRSPAYRAVQHLSARLWSALVLRGLADDPANEVSGEDLRRLLLPIARHVDALAHDLDEGVALDLGEDSPVTDA